MTYQPTFRAEVGQHHDASIMMLEILEIDASISGDASISDAGYGYSEVRATVGQMYFD